LFLLTFTALLLTGYAHSYRIDASRCHRSGQKCSAQSALFAHRNWVKAGFFDKIKQLAERRSTTDNTIVPVLTVTNQRYGDICSVLY
jgi:1-pyrroline-5-carboxylate dehydrogenase